MKLKPFLTSFPSDKILSRTSATRKVAVASIACLPLVGPTNMGTVFCPVIARSFCCTSLSLSGLRSGLVGIKSANSGVHKCSSLPLSRWSEPVDPTAAHRLVTAKPVTLLRRQYPSRRHQLPSQLQPRRHCSRTQLPHHLSTCSRRCVFCLTFTVALSFFFSDGVVRLFLNYMPVELFSRGYFRGEAAATQWTTGLGASVGLTADSRSHVTSGDDCLSPHYLARVLRQRIHVHASDHMGDDFVFFRFSVRCVV